MVERFLEKLRRRKCVFEIVFFARNARLCIPAHAEKGIEDRYLLAREAIIQHLGSISSEAEFITVKLFDNSEVSSFEEHLVNSGVYLIVCHDGALPDRSNDSENDNSSNWIDSDLSSDEESESDFEDELEEGEGETEAPAFQSDNRVILRRMIHWVCAHGYHVSLINSLEFRDTKVFFPLPQTRTRILTVA